MSFVLDASTTMTWCFIDESTAFSRSLLKRLSGAYAEVPGIWPLEVANVLLISERRKRIDSLAADNFLALLSRLDIRVETGTQIAAGAFVLELARRYRLTAYDAAYLALAKKKGLPLATLDKNLQRAARQEAAALLEPEGASPT